MSRSRIWFLVVLLFFFVDVPAMAWEFSMHGEYEWQFSYFARTGQNDLFGNVNAAPTNVGLTTIGFSGPWNGTVVPEGLSSKGSDGSYSQERFWLWPSLHVNQAVSINSIVSIAGSFNGPYTGGANWINVPHRAGWVRAEDRTEEFGNSIAVPTIKALWVALETPLGQFSFGRRPLPFGVGWSGLHERDTTTTAVMLKVPWGPFNMLAGHVISDTGEFSDPYDTRNVNKTPLTLVSTSDRNELRKWNSIYAIEYTGETFQFGVLNRTITYGSVHGLPVPFATLRDDITASWMFPFLQASYNTQGQQSQNTSWPVYGDGIFMLNVAYLKFQYGRFFFNGEYDQEYLKVTRTGGRGISGYPKAWMLEGGLFSGPWRFMVANFYRQGHDRQGGTLDVASPTGQTGTTQVGDSWSQFMVMGGGQEAIKPYNFLIGYFGTGNNSYDPSGYPTYLDFMALAARVDYALASNLGMWASWMYARRASNTGTWTGQFTGGIDPPTTHGSNVPDNNLGQEVDLGLTWKLLENVKWDTTFGIWKPGRWFQSAYTDYSQPNLTKDALSQISIRVTPDRSIDPIIGMRTGLTVEF
jgi:hypothetical protein